MNGKRILLMATFAAFATIVMPAAFAGTVSNQANITVKWNTLAVGSMVLNSNYSAAGAQQLTAPAILQTQNGGIGTCSTSGAGSEVAATVNFFSVTADGTKFTDCQYKNAVIATVTTSDPNGYTVGTQNVTGALPANYGICGLANGVNNAPGTVAWANNGAVFQNLTGGATSITSLPCAVSAGKTFDAGTTTATTIFTGGTSTVGTNLGADYVLVIGPNAATGAQTFLVQYTLTLT